MAAKKLFTLILLMNFAMKRIFCSGIEKTDIKIVTDENRYFTLNPDATYKTFKRTNHAKGNIFFKIGDRISGDRLVVTHMDSTSFTRPTDIEVSQWYPAEGSEGCTISCIEFVTDLSTQKAAAYLVEPGGIFETYAETLLCANETLNFGYQVYIYGF